MKKPFTDAYIPRQHLGPEGHYVPRKAREEAEIARRHDMRSGTLLLERQHQGLTVLDAVFASATTPDELAFVTKALAMATANSAWYQYARQAPVMNRRQKIPVIMNHETDERMTAEQLRNQTKRSIEIAIDMSGILLHRYMQGTEKPLGFTVVGRRMGNLSLELAVMQYNATSLGGNAVEVQNEVRNIALQTTEDARNFVTEIGAHPSIAQLPDPYSEMGVYFQDKAPTPVLNGYMAAVKELDLAA